MWCEVAIGAFVPPSGTGVLLYKIARVRLVSSFFRFPILSNVCCIIACRLRVNPPTSASVYYRSHLRDMFGKGEHSWGRER